MMTGCSGGWASSSHLPPTIVVQPISQSVAAGLSVTFSVTATGTGPFTYQWYKGTVAITGANSSSYTTSTAMADNGTVFTVTVTNEAGAVTSVSAVLTVTAAALQSIAVTPASPSIAKGKTQQFTATGTYTDNSTQNITTTVTWSSASMAVATIGTGTGLATAAGIGTSQITATQGAIVSPAATLTVNAATLQSIAVTPASPSIVKGTTQQFIATGTYSDNSTQNLTASVVWASGTTGVATIGASTGLATSVTTGTSQITATVGAIVSPADLLTVINSTPVATSLVCSSAAPPYDSPINLVPTFSGGTAVIGSTGLNSSDITESAVSGSSYPTPALTSAKTYTLTVTGTGENTATATCTTTPMNVSVSNISPSGQTMGPGQQSFSAVVTGGVSNAVTWSVSSGGGSFVGNVWTSSNTAGTYTITATSVEEPSVFASVMMAISRPVFTAQPASQNACGNGTLTLSAAASYATRYQWNLNGDPISGATNSTYVVSNPTSANAGSYTVTASNAAGAANSNSAQVVVGSTITAQPASLTVNATQTATFSVSVTGQSPFQYQWYATEPDPATGPISGATSSTYTTPPVDNTYNFFQYHVTATDACGTVLTSDLATLMVTNNNVPPTIVTQPQGTSVAVNGSTASFTVVASGTAPPALTYQWYRIPAGSVAGTAIVGATAATYNVPSGSAAAGNDQDKYYVKVSNNYGQAVSEDATLAVGNGILIQITNQPATQYVNQGDSATFQISATSAAPSLTYQWYEAPPGSSTFTAISGATSASYTIASASADETASVFRVVVGNQGLTSPVTSSTAALFVGALSGINNFCNASGWMKEGSTTGPTGSGSNCAYQLTAADTGEYGEIVWPTLVSTANIELSFTIAVSNASNPPADGFAMVLGDPSLGALPTSAGAPGGGLGAEGIPGFVLGFDTFLNVGDPPVPYLGVGRGETALWENPWLNVNTNIPLLASHTMTETHSYVVTIVQGRMTVTMDGTQVFSGNVSVPPVAYLYFTASTGSLYEQTVIQSLTATVSAP
ncbi:MAG: Ig-like domain-containing protein [Candidatus Acidiferrales bacterium]